MKKITLTTTQIVSHGNRASYSKDTFSLFGPQYDKRNRSNKNRVLEALASTVKPIAPPLLFGKSMADYFFTRFDRSAYLKLTMCAEAGRKAAERVINMHPELFPGFNAAPNLGDVPTRPKIPEKACLEKLMFFLLNHVAEEAYTCYTEMCSDADSQRPSVEILNVLIDLIGVRGIGNVRKLSKEHLSPDVSSIPEKELTRMMDITKDPEKLKEINYNSKYSVYKKIWLPNNPAELLFSELVKSGEANQGTYEALLNGLAKHDYPNRFLYIFDEMLSKGYQPSLRSYNNLFQIYIFHYKHLNLTGDNLVEKLNFFIGQMNKNPIVPPSETTFLWMMILSQIVRKLDRVKYFPSSYMIFREMMYTHKLNINLAHLSKLISPNVPYFREISDYLQKNENKLFQLQSIHDLYCIPSALRNAINLKIPDLIEYYYHIDKCMNFIGESTSPRVTSSTAMYLDYKVEQLTTSNEEQDGVKLYELFREQRLFFKHLEHKKIEQIINFFLENEKYDLYMKCVQGFISTIIPKAEHELVIKVLEQFGAYITELSESKNTNTDTYKQAAKLSWEIIGFLEKESDQSSLLAKFSPPALKLLIPIEPNKARDILSWLSKNSKKSVPSYFYIKLFESYINQRNTTELKMSLDKFLTEDVIIDNNIFTRVADFINLNEHQKNYYYSKLVEGKKTNFRFSLHEYFNSLDKNTQTLFK